MNIASLLKVGIEIKMHPRSGRVSATHMQTNKRRYFQFYSAPESYPHDLVSRIILEKVGARASALLYSKARTSILVYELGCCEQLNEFFS